MRISDFKGILKKTVATVENVKNPHGNYYVINLKVEEGFTWKPGEHGIFSFSNLKVEGKAWRVFSVASIPEEGLIKIGTKIGDEISSFKKNLINLEKGDQVKIRGPFGWFKLQDDISPIVFIASGIGITPIRALLKEIEKKNLRKIDIVYASRGYYLFEDEIKDIVDKDRNINLYLTKNTEETQKIITDMAIKNGDETYYYVSGSPKVIRSVKKLLKSETVRGSQIINDPFFGY
jgi:NAD(P)H-flavin reductase